MAYEVSIEWDNGDVTYLMYRRHRGGIVEWLPANEETRLLDAKHFTTEAAAWDKAETLGGELFIETIEV